MRASGEQVKILYRDYVSPDCEAINKFTTRKQPIPKQSLRTFRESARLTLYNPEVSHSSTLYPSFKVSNKVLNKNRATYEKVMNAMNQIEAESIANTYRSVMENKTKLEFFRIHCKTLPKSK